MATRERVAGALATEILAGRWRAAALRRTVRRVLGSGRRGEQGQLVMRLLAARMEAYPPSPEWLVERLMTSPYFDDQARWRLRPLRRLKPSLRQPTFAPAAALADLSVPQLRTLGDLAQWLAMSIERLDWLADSRRQHEQTKIPILQHYRYVFAAKRAGPPRLIEQPKPQLMAVQRRILREILDLVPAHPAAHGFIKGRSALSGAAVHAGERVVVCFDIAGFFPSVLPRRVHGIFRSLGYPWAVARLLTGLCTTSTPEQVFLRSPEGRRHGFQSRKQFASPHLPQGAPTSPALANLAAWRMDVRLQGLASHLGLAYTRYADDLTFSGPLHSARGAARLQTVVAGILEDEGFALQPRKTRLMRRAQRQVVTGLVVNDGVNVPRTEFEVLKAILHNCAKSGPEGQNHAGLTDFRAHIEGRVGWVEQINPTRGRRLRRVLDRIAW